jgi:DNA gyrase/topoisomerase IV subunit B
MITYFFRFFDQLVHDGHLYVLETPLFRVRTRQETLYCLLGGGARRGREAIWQRLRDHAVQGGWGDFADEFKQFIGKDMRLSQVEYAPKVEAAGILGFYMGKNTPERKDYIMENLVVPVEE